METPKGQPEYLYRRYTVSLHIDSIAGGTPLNKGLVAGHIAKFSEGVSNDLKLSKKQSGEVTEEAMQKYMLAVSSGFLLDELQGIYIRGYQFNAMYKDAAQRMKATMKQKGLGNTIRDGGLQFPDRIYLGVPPSIVERPVKPDNGSANVSIFQTASDIDLQLPCAVLDNGDLPDELFKQVWVVAQGIGIGAHRHLGYGRFEVLGIEDNDSLKITDLFMKRPYGNASPVPTYTTATPKPAAPDWPMAGVPVEETFPSVAGN